MKFNKVGKKEDLWSGEMKGVICENKKILLINWEGEILAYEDRCPHKGIPLSEGTLKGNQLICKAHLWVFNAQTGAGINPKTAQLQTFPVHVDEEGNILIGMEK